MNTDELQSYHAQLAAEDRNETQGLSTLINKLETLANELKSQDDYKKCYKPHRTLNNY